MPPQPAQRHRPPREFALPNGTRVIVASADSLHSVRQQYRECDEPVEVVVRGSVEHADYLKQSHKHHESRRAQLKERHGAAFDEWEDVQQQINSVTSELSRMSTQSSGLHVNYNKFGYSSGVRTYDDEGEGDNGVESKHPNGSAGAAHESKGGHHEKTTIKLAQRPALRQWFYQNVIWRATEQTEVMAVELFLDLIYVGIIHSNGEHMSEDPTGSELLRFCITFIMSWKIWTDITMALGWFGSDDVLTRMEILFEIACLLAFTTNMINCFAEDESENTYTQLVSFFLAARLLFAVHNAVAGFLVPMIRGVLWTSIIAILVPSALWIASIHVAMPNRLALIWPAILLDMYGPGFSLSVFFYGRKLREDSCIERMNAFVSLVLGYSVVGILFQSNGGYNVNAFLGKAVIGLCQAFFFNWLYFDVDGSSLRMHAIRHSAFSSFLWQLFHLPFIMGYIVATSALSTLVLATDVPNANPEQLTESYASRAEDHFGIGVRYFYCQGLAIALLSMGVIALSHAHREPETMRLAKAYRLANRVAACLIMFFLPLAHKLSSLQLVSTTLGITLWVLIVELWGRSSTDESFLPSHQDTCKMHAITKALRRNDSESQSTFDQVDGADRMGDTGAEKPMI